MTRLDIPQSLDEERIHSDQSLILAHGARSLLVTGLVLVMAVAAMATDPLAYPPWHTPAAALPGIVLAGIYGCLACLAWTWSRTAAGGAVVPLGAHGDARFVLALAATAGLVIPPALLDVPVQMLILTGASFVLLFIAAALCGLADGAWVGAAMRHLQLPFFRTLAAFARAVRFPGACSWRIVVAPAPSASPAPPAALASPLEQVHPDPSLIMAHGTRSLVLTLAVLTMGAVSFIAAPPIDQPWLLVAGAWPAFAAVAFLARRRRPDIAIPIGAHGDSRVVFALLAMALFIAIPDGRVDELIDGLPSAAETAAPVEDGPPAWLIPAATEAFTLGLAPLPFVLLLVASVVCGIADGAWLAMAMRHLDLGFRQALVALLRGAIAGVRGPGRKSL